MICTFTLLAAAVAKCFGYSPEDSTRHLQAALDSGEPTIVLEAQEGPWIASKPLKGRSNQTIVFGKGAYIQAKRGAFKGLGETLLTFENCTNVVILGAGPDVCGLRMWRDDYDDKAQYAHSEWRHGIALLSCVNVRIEGISVTDTGGDGLYVSSSSKRTDHDGMRGSRNVVVRNCVFDRNYRQGISIIGVDGFLGEDVVMSNTRGTPPAAGIDFEPNRAVQCIRNIVLRRCRIEENQGNGIEFAHGHLGAETEASSILVEDSTIVGNERGFYYAIGEADMDSAVDGGCVTLRNCTFRETRGQSVYVSKRPNCRGSVSFIGCRFENCGVEQPDMPDFRLSVCGHTLCEPDAYLFEDVTVVRKEKRPLMHDLKREVPYRGTPTRLAGRIRVVSGDAVETVTFDDEWRRKCCPFEAHAMPPALFRVDSPLGAMQVVDEHPGEQLPCAPAFVRGRGRFATFHAEAGQEVRLELVVTLIGKRSYDATRMLAVHPRGGDEVVAKIEPPRSAKPEVRSFKVPRAGFYDVYFETAYNGVAIKSCNVPIALDATMSMVPLVGATGSCGKWIKSAKERMLVFVPGNSPFECYVACAAGETAALEVFDPSGSRRLAVPTIEGLERFQSSAASDGFWGIRIGAPAYGAFEDFRLGVRGVPGWIFLSAGRAWKPAVQGVK